MSDKLNPAIAKAVGDVIEERKSKGFQYRCNHCGNEYPINSHGPSTCGDCGEPMHIHSIDDTEAERAAANAAKTDGADDVLVALGDLSEADLKDIVFGKNYEAIAMDYVATFNGAVTQGVNPLKAMMAMCQATAIVMGQCIRAGLRLQVASGMIKYIVDAAGKANSEVRIITQSTKQ